MMDFFTQWHSHLIDPDRLPLAALAILFTVVIGMITGPLMGNANPLIWLFFDAILGGFGDRLDRGHRSHKSLIFRGLFLTVCALILAVLWGRFYEAMVLQKPVSGITEIVLLGTLISTGAVWFALLRLYFALEKGKTGQKIPEGAYYAISRSTRRNLSISDDFSITRVGMGYAARSFDKGLVAPVFWYLVAGLPGAVIYSALSAIAWRFGRDGFTQGFGSVPLALERLLGFVPSLFAALLITMASMFTPTAKLHKGLASWFGHKNRATYEQGGFPLSALAWSLNVSLGGASQDLAGNAIKGEWVGPEGTTARNDHKHLRRAIYFNVAAHILFVATLMGAYVWSGHLFNI